MSRLKELREGAGLSQQALANKAGLSIRIISALENGGNPRLSTLKALSKVLGVSISELVGEKPHRKRGAA